MFKKTIAFIAITISLTACTPIQISTYQKVTGERIPAKIASDLLLLPDKAMILPDGRTIRTDGVVTPAPVPPPNYPCAEWFDESLRAGWSESDWPRLSQIIWRESRCQRTAHNPHGRDNSYGLMQLNMRAHAGWVGPLVGGDFTRLWDGETNLRIARTLHGMAANMYGCGWQPWAFSC